MTIEILSVFTACGIVVAFGMGFFLGIGYQRTEDNAEIRHLERKAKKDKTEMLRKAKELYHRGYDEGMRDQQKATQDRIDLELQDFLKDLQPDEEEVKFGRF